MRAYGSPAVEKYDGQVAEAGHRSNENEKHSEADVSPTGGRGKGQPMVWDKGQQIYWSVHACGGKVGRNN